GLNEAVPFTSACLGWMAKRIRLLLERWGRRRGGFGSRADSGIACTVIGNVETCRDLGGEEPVRGLLGARASDQRHECLDLALREGSRIADPAEWPGARATNEADSPGLAVVVCDARLGILPFEHHLDALFLDECDELLLVL